MIPNRELTAEERQDACREVMAEAVAFREAFGLTAGALVPVPWPGTEDERGVVQRMVDNRKASIILLMDA